MTTPDPAEFHAAAQARATEMADFARAASGVPPLDDDQTTWLLVGITSGITSAVEELHARGLIGGTE